MKTIYKVIQGSNNRYTPEFFFENAKMAFDFCDYLNKGNGASSNFSVVQECSIFTVEDRFRFKEGELDIFPIVPLVNMETTFDFNIDNTRTTE